MRKREAARSLARAEQLQAELLHLSRQSAMGQMAATLAHELNQPLSAIGNYLSGARKLLSGPGDLTRLDEAVAKAGEQAMRAGEIIRRLREFVLKGEISKEWHDLNQVLDKSLKLALVGPKPLGVRVETRLDPNIPPVFIDRIQISQVVFNIVRNARYARAAAVCNNPIPQGSPQMSNSRLRIRGMDLIRGRSTALSAIRDHQSKWHGHRTIHLPDDRRNPRGALSQRPKMRVEGLPSM